MSPAREPADAFTRVREVAWLLHRLVVNNTRDRKVKVQVTISSENEGFWEVLKAIENSPSILQYRAYPDNSGDFKVYDVHFKFERINV